MKITLAAIVCILKLLLWKVYHNVVDISGFSKIFIATAERKKPSSSAWSMVDAIQLSALAAADTFVVINAIIANLRMQQRGETKTTKLRN